MLIRKDKRGHCRCLVRFGRETNNVSGAAERLPELEAGQRMNRICAIDEHKIDIASIQPVANAAPF